MVLVTGVMANCYHSMVLPLGISDGEGVLLGVRFDYINSVAIIAVVVHSI